MSSTNDSRARASRPRDTTAFLANYPGISKSNLKSDPSVNYLFYLNRLRCQPDNLLIGDIHSKLGGTQTAGEPRLHTMTISDPRRRDGVTADTYQLLPHEIGKMRNGEEIIRRLVTSYKMMLDFYGMRLISESGLLGRALSPRDFKPCYRNLLGKTHNNLCITRILKYLSELGTEHLNPGFLLHVLNEQSDHGMLNSASIRVSMDRWWANCIRDDHERDWVCNAIAKVRSGGLFTREMYGIAMRIRHSTRRFSINMVI